MNDLLFIHSGFRSGSSWIRSKFRSAGNRLVFGEIFHELLAEIDTRTAASMSTEDWRSRHPATAPYFMEYVPLIRPNGGVAEYSKEMAFDLYFPSSEGLTDQEQKYIQRLLDHTAAMGKHPVLSCTRSLGRLEQIKKSFGGYHILLTRDPFRQWCSYTEVAAGGNLYFTGTNDLILRAAQKSGWINLGASNGDSQKFLHREDFYQHVLLHMKLYSEILPEADLIIYYERLEEKAYRKEITDKISADCGVVLDLSDFRNSHQFSLIDLPPLKVIDQVLQPVLPPLDQMHPHLVELHEGMKASLKHYQGEAGELVMFSRRKLAELSDSTDELEKIRAELNGVVSALESAQGALAQSSAELNEMHVRLDSDRTALENARNEIEALRNQLSATETDRERVRAELAKLQVEFERRGGELNETRMRRETEHAKLETTEYERSQAIAALESLTVEANLARERESAAVAREVAAERAYREATDRMWRERQAVEGQLRAAAHEAEQTVSVQAAELGRLSELSAQLQEQLRRSEKNSAELQERLGRVLAERPGFWQRIGSALGLTSDSRAAQDLSRWAARRKTADSGSPNLELPQDDRMPSPMPVSPATDNRNPYLRAHSIDELLAWDDIEFVRCAYVTVLGRQADPEGEAYYTDRIRRGHSKMEVLSQLRRSREGAENDPGIADFDRALKKAAWARHRVVGVFVRAITRAEPDDRLAKLRRSVINELRVLRLKLDRLVESEDASDPQPPEVPTQQTMPTSARARRIAVIVTDSKAEC